MSVPTPGTTIGLDAGSTGVPLTASPWTPLPAVSASAECRPTLASATREISSAVTRPCSMLTFMRVASACETSPGPYQERGDRSRPIPEGDLLMAERRERGSAIVVYRPICGQVTVQVTVDAGQHGVGSPAAGSCLHGGWDRRWHDERRCSQAHHRRHDLERRRTPDRPVRSPHPHASSRHLLGHLLARSPVMVAAYCEQDVRSR